MYVYVYKIHAFNRVRSRAEVVNWNYRDGFEKDKR
jgi:hypothetical protein